MSGRVIVVGSVNIDLVARVPHLPRPGETVTGGSYDRHHGGKGGNQAVAAARLRRPTLFIGAVGDDVFASEARRALSTERVDVSMVAALAGQPTGVALILVDASGENEIAVVPGANGAIEPGYVRESLARLGRLTGDVLLVCNEVPVPIVREALVSARGAGATTIFNPAPALGVDRSVFGLADVITPNRTELATLLQTEARRTGRRVDSSQDIAGRARLLLEPGPEGPGVRRAVIVTVGASGVVVLERPAPPSARPVAASAMSGERAPQASGEAAAPSATVGAPPGADLPSGASAPPAEAPPAAAPFGPLSPPASLISVDANLRTWEAPAQRVSTIDSTGAGDAFNGALAAAIAEGRSLEEAVQRAIAGGALATTRVGAREGMPTARELEEFIASR